MTSSLSTQFRDLLDTATLADIRRLEGTGAGGTSPQRCAPPAPCGPAPRSSTRRHAPSARAAQREASRGVTRPRSTLCSSGCGPRALSGRVSGRRSPLAGGPGSARAERRRPRDNERYSCAASRRRADSNARRTEEIRDTQSGAGRSLLQSVVLSARSSDIPAAGHVVSVGDRRRQVVRRRGRASENVAIAQSSVAWRAGVGRGVLLTLAGAYYEAFQNPDAGADRRDFRSLAPRWSSARGSATADTAGGGYRMLVFKPTRPRLHGPTRGQSALGAASEEGADWDAAAERRSSGASPGGARRPATRPRPTGCLVRGPRAHRQPHHDPRRRDPHRPRADRHGLRVHYNASNSFGETVMRHFASARFASRPALAAVRRRARRPAVRVLQRTVAIGKPTSPGSPYASIEDENRSSSRVDLSRDFGEHWRIFARYTFYANELGANSPLTYRRHTVLLSLAFASRNEAKVKGDGPQPKRRPPPGRELHHAAHAAHTTHAAHATAAAAGAGGASSFGRSTTSASVVTSSAATDAAFCSAERTTLVGSMTPPRPGPRTRRCRVVAEGALALAHAVDDDRAFFAGVGRDLPARLLARAADDGNADRLLLVTPRSCRPTPARGPARRRRRGRCPLRPPRASRAARPRRAPSSPSSRSRSPRRRG